MISDQTYRGLSNEVIVIMVGYSNKKKKNTSYIQKKHTESKQPKFLSKMSEENITLHKERALCLVYLINLLVWR